MTEWKATADADSLLRSEWKAKNEGNQRRQYWSKSRASIKTYKRQQRPKQATTTTKTNNNNDQNKQQQRPKQPTTTTNAGILRFAQNDGIYI
jgi:hypothetical protein